MYRIYDSKCSFCSEFRMKTSNEVRELFDEENITRLVQPRINRKNSKLIVMPDICPILEGHALICPVNHYESFYFAKPLLVFRELYQLILKIKNCYSFSENVIFYEHGGNSCNKTGQCVSHAHVHFFPCTNENIRKLNLALEKDTRLIKIVEVYGESNYWNILKKIQDFAGYIAVFFFQEEKILWNLYYANNIPSQFIRHTFAYVNKIPPSILEIEDIKVSIKKTIYELQNNLLRYDEV